MVGYGSRIKAARERNCLTQEELGARLGITGVTIMRYEKEQREPNLQTLRDISSELDVSISYLLGEIAEPLSPSLQQAFWDILLERISEKLMSADSTDLIEQFGTAHPYEDIFEGRVTLTSKKVEEIADDLGVPWEYLIAGKNDPADHYPFVDDDLQDQLDTADARLIDTVHRICGMDPRSTHSPQDWNPAKIDLVCEYIKDSHAILQKMLAATEPKENSGSE